MNKLRQILSGKKTYIVAAATIVYCILGISLHFMALPTAIAFIGSTGSLAMLRVGVGKAQAVLEVILEILKIIGQTMPTTAAVTGAITTAAMSTENPVTLEKPIIQ